MIKFYTSIILLLGMLSINQAVAQIIQQNVIAGELPDPSIIEVDGIYYATGSSNDWGPIYPIYKSKDLENWNLISYVFQEKPDWTKSSYWAPELFYQNGTFYCYYTAKRTDGTSMLGVATSKDISKGFTDHGELLEWGEEAIDAFVYREKSKLFITWKAYGLTQDKPIQILGAELSKDGLTVKGEAFNMLTANTDSWERGGIEGQCIIKNGDYLYMFYSGNACCGATCDYQVGVARAKTIKGPWEKYERNSLLKGNEIWKCPGHGTAIKTNRKWYYLYHAYPSKGFPYLGRTVLLSQIQWDQNSGWPYFKEDASYGSSKVLMKDFNDDFSSKKLGNQWRYDIPSYTFKTAIKDKKLTLTEIKRSENNNSGAVIGVNPEDADFTITTKIVGHNKALKGIALYVTKENSLGVGVKGNSLILWKVKDGQFEELNTIPLEKTENLFLKGRITDAHIGEFQYSHNGNKWQSIKNKKENSLRVTGNNLSWWSWGLKAGLFVQIDAESGNNQAVFDEFHIEYE